MLLTKIQMIKYNLTRRRSTAARNASMSSAGLFRTTDSAGHDFEGFLIFNSTFSQEQMELEMIVSHTPFHSVFPALRFLDY